MKKLITLTLLLYSFLMFSQQAEKVTFSQSIEKAKKENKKILLYFSGSDWCAPCVKFKKQFIYTDQFKSFAEENLIVFNADFPRLKKNQLPPDTVQENESLADKYNNKGLFPLILLLNNDGTILKKWEHLPTESLDTFISEIK
ncbi:MAG TPA: thioredoxin family protein [Flavobacterium sp.]|nr:thioredoxin family protein [Flavobacterium sp.]